MTTRTPYRISQMEDRMSEMLKAQEAEESRAEGTVEVPAWRIKLYEPITDPTGYPEIEDLSEAVFLKRHQRLEIDEKRRKRWDSQRAREETYLER
jgi:male-specific lethal 1